MYTIHSKYNFSSACEHINILVFHSQGKYELTVDSKDEILDDETLEFIDTLSELDISYILYDYGLDEAITLYTDTFSGKICNSKDLLYHIIRKGLSEHDGYVNDEDLDSKTDEE